MTAKNYHIKREIEHGAGSRAYIWGDADCLNRVGEAMPAVFDFDRDGTNYRVEILYIQGRLKTLNRTIEVQEPTADSKFILQVGVENPTSFVLRMDSLEKKSRSHSTGSAWLLEDEKARIVGVEVVLPQ